MDNPLVIILVAPSRSARRVGTSSSESVWMNGHQKIGRIVPLFYHDMNIMIEGIMYGLFILYIAQAPPISNVNMQI